MYVTERSSEGANTIGKAVTLSTSPDAGCTARVPNEIAPVWSALAEHRTPASVFLTPEWIAVARAHSKDQAVTLAQGVPIAGKMSQRGGRNAAHCPGRPLQRQGHPKIVSNRFAETIFGTRP